MTDEMSRMLKTGSLVILACAGLIYSMQYARSIDRTYPPRTFSVDGQADIDVVPDIASFSATVITEGGLSVSDLQMKNTGKMNQIITFLKEQGVDKKDLKTVDYNLGPRYSNSICAEGICPPATIVGYTITQGLRVKVRDIEKVGDLLEGAVKQGANSVSSVQLVVDDDTRSKDMARVTAMQKARSEAEAVAQAGGFRLGRLVGYYESGEPMPQPYGMGMGGAADTVSVKQMAAPAIEPGTQKSSVTVNLTFEIVD